MPAVIAKLRKQFEEGREMLDFDLEQTLVFGQGPISTGLQLRTLEDWQAAWHQWREVVMPKAIEHRPGTRPFACYVVGEIPEREVRMQPPLSKDFFKLYIPSTDGSGRWHCRYPEPFMRAEHLHLRDLGIVDEAEMKRAREWRRKQAEASRREGIETYPLEHGLHE